MLSVRYQRLLQKAIAGVKKTIPLGIENKDSATLKMPVALCIRVNLFFFISFVRE